MSHYYHGGPCIQHTFNTDFSSDVPGVCPMILTVIGRQAKTLKVKLIVSSQPPPASCPPHHLICIICRVCSRGAFGNNQSILHITVYIATQESHILGYHSGE